MANIDPRFICTSDLDSLYRDNATGLPLSGGIVTFYSDVNRTSLKPVYQLTGQPGNYTYAPLPNPCVLSSAGTFQDALGNNIVPYYYPFTGTPSQNTGVQELYYITVQNSGFVPQFVRQGWPQAAASNINPPSDLEIENYIPNGQFLSHNNPLSITEPPVISYTYPLNAQVLNGQPIAQGGWFFTYTNGTTSTFNNSFSVIPPSGGWNMNSFPRYAFNFVCTQNTSPPFTQDLRIEWPDVNKFSTGNPPGTIPYTLFFDAKSNDSNTYVFTLYLIYYFGTGGSPSNPIETPLAQITVSPGGFKSQNISSIVFPANQGTIGSNNDDYVALSIRGPNSTWNAAFTDFALVQGNENLSYFPIQTNDEMLSRGVAGWMPTPDPLGNDLYLPLILTTSGMIFDHSIVGQIVGKTEINPVNNELLMDGSVKISSAYSSLGIPYKRLLNYLVTNQAAVTVTNGSSNSTIPAGTTPMFGTGPLFVTILQNNDPTKFDLSMNTAGGSNAVSNGTSGFTHTSADPLYVFTVTGVPTAGTFFSFTAHDTLVYNVWFTVNGVGTAPTSPTGANILVAIVTGDTVATTIVKILTAVNQYQFQILDARGYFWRGLDASATIDPNAASRTLPGISDNTNAWTGAHLGSVESDAFKSHTHTATNVATTGQNLATDAAYTLPLCNNIPIATNVAIAITTTIGNTGGLETRPVNLAINWFIKY